MDGPASVPLPNHSRLEWLHVNFVGTRYMKDSIDKAQPRITCRVDEEGGDEVDLEFMCLSVAKFPYLACIIAGLLGTRVPDQPVLRPIPLGMTFVRTCTALRRK